MSRNDAPPPDAYEVALRLLTRRPHGEIELRRQLARRRCEPEAIEAAMARVRRLGYLDDAAFARGVAATRVRTRGPALIARELASKGVERGVVRDVLDGLSREDVLSAATRLAARGVAAGTDRRVVATRLLRRGFPADVVREAVGAQAAEID